MLPYKSYTAGISQVGTGDPNEFILQNDVVSVGWIRTGTGHYRNDTGIPFVSDGKVWINGNSPGSNDLVTPVILNGPTLAGHISMHVSNVGGNYSIFLDSSNPITGSAKELSAILGADTLWLPEVRIYP